MYNSSIAIWFQLVVSIMGKVLCRRSLTKLNRQHRQGSIDQYFRAHSYHHSAPNSTMMSRKQTGGQQQPVKNRQLSSPQLQGSTRLSPTLEYMQVPTSNGYTAEENNTDIMLNNKTGYRLNDDDVNKVNVFDKQWCRVDRMLKELIKSLDNVISGSRDRETVYGSRRRNVSEWREVAVVLDRFFCLLYLVLIVVSLVFLFPRPHGFSFFS